MNNGFCVTVLYGSDQVKKFYNAEIFNENEINEYVKFYSFETEKELSAFILGLE